MRSNTIAPVLALCLMTALVPATTADDAVAPILVELQPNPEGIDRGNEWVELANPTPAPLPLDGLFLTEASGAVLALTGTIAPLGRLVVTLPGSFTLNNGGDTVTLSTDPSTGNPIVLQSVTYGTATIPAAGSGEAIYACSLAGAAHGSWTAGAATPGAANPAC